MREAKMFTHEIITPFGLLLVVNLTIYEIIYKPKMEVQCFEVILLNLKQKDPLLIQIFLGTRTYLFFPYKRQHLLCP